MCLSIAERTIFVADEDIVVYKRLRRKHGGVFCSPYFPAEWIVGETKILRHFVASGDNFQQYPFTDVIPDNINTVGYGLHAYSEFHTTRAEIPNPFQQDIVGKFIIPKGTKYIKGMYGDVVSLALKFVSIEVDALQEFFDRIFKRGIPL